MKQLIRKLKLRGYSFSDLPSPGKKALIQFRLIEDEDWGQELVCKAMDKRYIEPDEASQLCERLYNALEEFSLGREDDAISISEEVFNLFPKGDYLFSYLEVPSEELIDYVQSFTGFESEPKPLGNIEKCQSDINKELWAVIIPEYDELPIWDGMNRLKNAINQKIKTIPVLLYK